MARKTNGNVILTLEELQWITDALNRRVQATEKLKSPRERALVKTLSAKAEDLMGNLPGPSEPIILKASRVEAKYLQGIAKGVRDALLTKIIPGYADKLKTEDPKRIKPYLDRAQEKANVLTQIVNKIGACL